MVTQTKTTSDVGTKVKETVEKGKETASTVGEKIKETAAGLTDKAKDTVDSAASTVGTGMESLAGTIRDKGPSSGMLGTATGKVADTLESGGRYLEEKGLTGMANDMTELIKRNPLPAMLVGIGLGYLLGRALRS